MIALPLALILGIPALATIVLMFVSHETRKTTKEYTAQAWKATSAASKALFVVAIALAATYPERVETLGLFGSGARIVGVTQAAPDEPAADAGPEEQED